MAGLPVDPIDALIRQGATDLALVPNNTGNGVLADLASPGSRVTVKGAHA